MRQISFSIIIFSLAIAAIGIWMLPRLDIDFLPSYSGRSLSISYAHPEGTSQFIEQNITVPIEAGLATIQGVDKITSEVSDKYGVTRVELDKSVDMDYVRFEISQMIRQLYESLPDRSNYPNIKVNDPETKELNPTMLSYSYSGPGDRVSLGVYARDQIVPLLSQIDGVHEISLTGIEDLEWRIVYDVEQIEAVGISIERVKNKIIEYFSTNVLSYHRTNKDEYLYVVIPEPSVEDLRNLHITSDHGESTIIVGDLVDFELLEQDAHRHYRINGENSITLNFVAESSSNHIALSNEIKKKINEISLGLPAGCKLLKGYDTTEYIAVELDKIKVRSLWSISILVIFMILTYRSFHRVTLLLLSLLINLSIASLLYYIFEVKLNLYALAGVTVSFGIIMDNMILAAHHYHRNANISFAPSLITASLTTLSALLIIFFLPERLQWDLLMFSKVISINLISSLFVSIWVVPSLLIQFYPTIPPLSKSPKSVGLIKMNIFYKRLVSRLITYRKWAIVLMVLLFGIPTFWLPKQIEGIKLYNNTVGSDLYQDKIRKWVDKGLGGSLRLFSLYVYEDSSYRSTEETVLYVNAGMPHGSTLEQMDDLTKKMESFLAQFKGNIKEYVTQINSGQYAQIKISFPENGNFSFPHLLKSRIQSAAIDLGGVEWSIYGVGKGFNSGSGSRPPSFRVMLKGYNQQDLKYWTGYLAKLLIEHPRIQAVDTNANINWWQKDKYEYVVQLDERTLKHQGLDKVSMQGLLNQYNLDPQYLTVTQDNVPVTWQSKKVRDGQADIWNLINRQHNYDSRSIMLADMSSIRKEKKSNAIHKEDQQYLKMLEFEYTGSGRFGQKYLDECLGQLTKILPLGYMAEQKNFNYWGANQKKQYGLLVLVGVIIFFICAIHFESLKAPLLIIALIPFSFIGIFLTFYWFDFPFDQGGYISFLLLSGLVVNSLIFILSDYYHNKRTLPHRSSIDMYLRAFRNKISPIFLTVISTALGLLPFTLHGSQEVFWFSLAVGTIGGLLFSILVLLFIIPSLVIRKGG